MKSIKIAVTGGIGSGKSTALSIIKDLGYSVVCLDDVYAQLLLEEEFVRLVSDEMGVLPLIFGGRLTLDRKSISKIVFSDEAMLKKLNKVTHDAIFQRAFSLIDDKIVFYEVPLLFEGDYVHLFDHVFVVLRDYEDRVKSAMARDGLTREEVELKIKNQVDYDKIDISKHTVIMNNFGLAELRQSIIRAIEVVKENI
jgi:dephospho-CoA kinase